MTSRRMMKAGLAIGLAASFHIAMAQVQLAQQPAAAGAPATAAPQAGRGADSGAASIREFSRGHICSQTRMNRYRMHCSLPPR